MTGRHLGAVALGMAAALPLLALVPAASLVQAAQSPHAAGGFTANQRWTVSLGDGSGSVALSSPNVANLDGQPSVVFGTQAGQVWAFHINGGSQPGGWPFNASAPVDSSPSVAAINGSGLDTVYVGSGDVQHASEGGYQAISPGGGNQWFVQSYNPPTDPVPDIGVQASMTVGALAGGLGVEAGNLGQNTFALQASNGAVFGGFPWFSADSVFSTAATADLYADGNTEIISGGDSSAGAAYGQTYGNGGHIRILSSSGTSGTLNPTGGLLCQYNTNQNIDRSSPAVGQFLPGGGVGIAIGDGSYYGGVSDSNKILVINTGCGLAWSQTLNGVTADSPALADVQGNGQLDVIEGTSNNTVYVLNGANGAVVWTATTSGQVIGSPVTADLTGDGYQDVIVPTTDGIEIFDGRSGGYVTTLGVNEGFQNSPLVTDDPDGHIGITGVGYAPSGTIVTHWEIDNTAGSGSSVYEQGAWPQFHHDPQLTGDAGTPAPTIEVPCNAPSSAPNGYILSASDGGVFNYGNIPFCGSTGSIHLAQPVVGAALTQDGGGYYEVARDGGLFAFGNAAFHGSMGGTPLNSPIVGMATTPDGGGYWEVASDGGIFSFGNAQFFGSTGGLHLNAPIVGMAPTADGMGYWLVASDGGIFAYGDAKFYGSTGGTPLNRPVVGIATDRATGGYWEVASDGGIFAYNAPFYGSTGGMRLNAPIVGMQATRDGSGYRFVATDGGIFSYKAPFYGSMGGVPLNKPVVAMTGT
ncbi:MAG TPA: VCBS repeat-containing protein [Acidimicrobiales bacterium]|nr:VCBS repeat-containing protein [Acidimicrobiales bacterium]